MKKSIKLVLAAISTRLANMKPIEAFRFSDETIALLTSDPVLAAAKVAQEKADYDALNVVSPMRAVVYNAVSAALSNLDTEEEARKVCQSALAGWLKSKGLRTLTSAQVERAAMGTQSEDDLPLAEIVAIGKAFMGKDLPDAKLKSATEIIKAFNLAETARSVFANSQDALRKVAQIQV